MSILVLGPIVSIVADVPPRSGSLGRWPDVRSESRTLELSVSFIRQLPRDALGRIVPPIDRIMPGHAPRRPGIGGRMYRMALSAANRSASGPRAMCSADITPREPVPVIQSRLTRERLQIKIPLRIASWLLRFSSVEKPFRRGPAPSWSNLAAAAIRLYRPVRPGYRAITTV
jgi:hypothetical protein